MITKLSPNVNGIQLGFQYEGFEISKDGKYARLTKPRIVLFGDLDSTDHKNVLYVSGSPIVKQKGQTTNIYRNVHCFGKGKKVIKRLAAEWVELKSQGSTRKALYANLAWATGQIELLKYISYPESK